MKKGKIDKHTGFKKQKSVALIHGVAHVDEDCPQETIDALNELSKAVFKMTQSQLNKLTPKH